MIESTRPRVAIIGAGPAGLIAADVLSAAGLAVTVFDQMRSPGRKFLLAGRGGLNITHSEPLNEFLNRYGPDRQFLEPAIRAFDADALREWSLGLGEATFVGSSGRVFPASFRATPLLRALLLRLQANGVEMRPQHRWTGWDTDDALSFVHPSLNDISFAADATILALGGASWPGTGATGAWTSILTTSGVGIVPLRPANCGFAVNWSPHFASRFAGIPLKNIALHYDDTTVRGEAMITSDGIEGGAIYALARALRTGIESGKGSRFFVDLQPDRDIDAVAEKLSTRRPKESSSNWLRRSLSLSRVGIALVREHTRNHIPDDMEQVALLVKRLPIDVTATQPIVRAISSAGGISKHEVDSNFMLHKRAGVYAVGEMLDWEAPTGGYLLQATFSTAVAAARAVIERHARST